MQGFWPNEGRPTSPPPPRKPDAITERTLEEYAKSLLRKLDEANDEIIRLRAGLKATQERLAQLQLKIIGDE